MGIRCIGVIINKVWKMDGFLLIEKDMELCDLCNKTLNLQWNLKPTIKSPFWVNFSEHFAAMCPYFEQL